jgi:hypothetical protein
VLFSRERRFGVIASEAKQSRGHEDSIPLCSRIASLAMTMRRRQYNFGRNIVDPQNIIRAGIAASVALHLSLLTLALVFSEVRPFDPVAAAEVRDVAVDVVTPDQVPETPSEPAPTPQSQTLDNLDLSLKPATQASPSGSSASNPSASNSPAPEPPAPRPASAQTQAAPPAMPQPPAQPQQLAALAPSRPVANATPSPVSPPERQPPATQPQGSAPVQAPTPAYVQPQPDISVKYHVLLGLPQDAPGDGFDAPATENADIEANSIVEFRRHLRNCSTLPNSVAATDDVAVKLRVALTRDGRLAGDPQLIEAKASMKGPLLMQAAIGALRSCQPYAMLPADKYDQWKVLDLSFTPRDFGGS